MEEVSQHSLTDSLDFGSDIVEPLIVGGELVSPTARFNGEADDTAAVERGWLVALTRAAIKVDSANGLQNVLDIATRAMELGVSRDKINNHLLSIGFDATRISAVTSAGSEATKLIKAAVEDGEPVVEKDIPSPVYEARIKAQLDNLAVSTHPELTRVNVEDAIASIILELLQRRKDYDQLMNERGGLMAVYQSTERQQYSMQLQAVNEQIKQGIGTRTVFEGAWFGVNTSSDLLEKIGTNLKWYETVDPTQPEFIQSLPDLVQQLRQLALDSDDRIKVKVPQNYTGFIERSDSLVVHFKKPENHLKVQQIVEGWKHAHGITDASRDYSRTKLAADTVLNGNKTSFSDGVARHVAGWVMEQAGKFENATIAHEAVSHALDIARKPPELRTS